MNQAAIYARVHRAARAWAEVSTLGKIAMIAAVLLAFTALFIAVGMSIEDKRKRGIAPVKVMVTDPELKAPAVKEAERNEALQAKCVDNIRLLMESARRELKANRPEKAVLVLIDCNYTMQDPEAIQLLEEAKSRQEQKAARLKAIAGPGRAGAGLLAPRQP